MAKGIKMRLYVQQLPKNRILRVKIALSTVNVDGAKINLKSERVQGVLENHVGEMESLGRFSF